MDPQLPSNYGNQNVPQQSINNHKLASSENKIDNPMASTAASEKKKSLNDKLLNPTTGESTAQDAKKSLNTTTNHPQNTSDLPRRSGPRAEGARLEKDGYERKIGRGTSWRRDHEALVEEDYSVRGRGRGAPSTRGRGHYRDYDSRDYPYRRDYDRRPPPPPPPPHHSLDPRGPPYPPPDPYYDSRGSFPSPPLYDNRRDYPPEPRYFDDYRRGYDPRDGPPPPPLPPQPLEPRRPFDRGPFPGREDPSDYGRPYSRPRDPRDEFRGDPRMPRDPEPRLPPDPRIPPRDERPDPRYLDEGIISRIFSLIIFRKRSQETR
jgi:hypothetical protein